MYLGDNLQMGRFFVRTLSDQLQLMGIYDEQFSFNSVIYNIEFPEGQVKDNSDNILADNMLSQLNTDVHNILLMNNIIDYRNNEATETPMKDKYLVTNTVQRRLRKINQVCGMLVSCKEFK